MAAHMQNKIERTLQELKDQYCKYVQNNPLTVGQIESAIRILSFLVAGRFENGPVLSELIYSASNLLVLLNDHVIKAASKFIPKLAKSVDHMKQWLTVLEYVEVFLEIAVQKKWGDTGAWIIITVIQITKAALRLYILLGQQAGIQPTPPIAPLDREAVITPSEGKHDVRPEKNKQKQMFEDAWEDEVQITPPDTTFTLPSSGRQIRTLKAAPPNSQRVWNLPREQVKTRAEVKREQMLLQPSNLNKNRILAECLHIARPVAHLCGMYVFGLMSWKPWLLACGMDVSSMCLMGDTSDLNSREKWELKRRSLMLLYYLLRSPFYDKFSKAKILVLLKFLSEQVPGVRLLLNPLIAYLPEWQKRYFYVWTT